MKHSILTEYEDISAFSGKPREAWHHLIFGRGMKDLAEIDLLKLPLLNCEHNCSSKGTIYQIHDNPAAENLSKMLGQVAWEKEYLAKELEKQGYDKEDILDKARTSFMARYGRSWL